MLLLWIAVKRCYADIMWAFVLSILPWEFISVSLPESTVTSRFPHLPCANITPVYINGKTIPIM